MTSSVRAQELVQRCGVEEAWLEREVRSDRLLEISRHLSEWKLLAVVLDITPAEVQEIESENLCSEVRVHSCLKKWQQKMNKAATYRVLVDSLLRIGRWDDAEVVCQVLRESNQRRARGSGESRGLVESGESMGLVESGESRGLRESGESRGLRESGESRGLRESGESRGLRESGESREPQTKGSTASVQIPSATLPHVIDSLRADKAFRDRLYALTSLLQTNLSTISVSLQAKAVISQEDQQEAMNESVIPKTRTVKLLDVLLCKMRFEPHVFTEFVKTLESIPALQIQAKELVLSYQGKLKESGIISRQTRPRESKAVEKKLHDRKRLGESSNSEVTARDRSESRDLGSRSHDRKRPRESHDQKRPRESRDLESRLHDRNRARESRDSKSRSHDRKRPRESRDSESRSHDRKKSRESRDSEAKLHDRKRLWKSMDSSHSRKRSYAKRSLELRDSSRGQKRLQGSSRGQSWESRDSEATSHDRKKSLESRGLEATSHGGKRSRDSERDQERLWESRDYQPRPRYSESSSHDQWESRYMSRDRKRSWESSDSEETSCDPRDSSIMSHRSRKPRKKKRASASFVTSSAASPSDSTALSPVVSQQPLPTISLRSTKPSITRSGLTSGVEGKIARLEKDFEDLVNSIEVSFIKNCVSLQKIQNVIKHIPMSLRRDLGEYFQDEASKILNTTSIQSLFINLSYHWDYLNPGLLNFIVGRFGSDNDILLLHTYLEKLKQFREAVKLGEYVQLRHAEISAYRYQKINLNMQGWEEQTLQDAEKLREEFTKECHVQSFLVPMYSRLSSIAIIFCLPTWMEFKIDELEPFFKRQKVVKVYHNDVCLIDWTKQISRAKEGFELHSKQEDSLQVKQEKEFKITELQERKEKGEQELQRDREEEEQRQHYELEEEELQCNREEEEQRQHYEREEELQKEEKREHYEREEIQRDREEEEEREHYEREEEMQCDREEEEEREHYERKEDIREEEMQHDRAEMQCDREEEEKEREHYEREEEIREEEMQHDREEEMQCDREVEEREHYERECMEEEVIQRFSKEKKALEHYEHECVKEKAHHIKKEEQEQEYMEETKEEEKGEHKPKPKQEHHHGKTKELEVSQSPGGIKKMHILTGTADTETKAAGKEFPREEPTTLTISSRLPSTIYSEMAVSSFKHQRGLMLNFIHHTFPSLPNSLFAWAIIPQDVLDYVNNPNLSISQRSGALLDCMEARIEAVPSDFIKVVQILESDPFLRALADQLVQSYCDIKLPSTIHSEMAVSSFRSQRRSILNLIRHCLPSLTNSLFAEDFIPGNVLRDANNMILSSSQRSDALLDHLEARIEAVPSDFTKVVHILESDPFLSSLADGLVHSYRTISSDLSQPATSLAMSHYRTYLKAVYKNSPISPENKWPPTPGRKYINLAMVKGQRCREDYIGHTLQGNISEILTAREEISIKQILEADVGQNKPRLILVEGAPGIGKSTLAWELCRKWEEFLGMKQYSLVVLLRLREEEVQKIKSTSDLFYSYEGTDKLLLVDEILTSHGSSLLFILDGFDELPKVLQQKGYLLSLINGTVLPNSTVLVTSKPSATAELYKNCGPRVQKHVEILGFTRERVEEYAASIFVQPQRLQRFTAYISASHDLSINSLMYVPLNAAIIADMFQNRKSDALVPYTLTELYTQLILIILNRYLMSHSVTGLINSFNSLPGNLYPYFLKLSKKAFEGMVEEKVFFDTLPADLIHFGFLDAVPTLYGRTTVTYNFLHLTLQEFFAAIHISQLGTDSGVQLLKRYGGDQRWNLVWRFVAGLTQFKDYREFKADCLLGEDSESVSKLFVQCLFEAQTMEHIHTMLNFTIKDVVLSYRSSAFHDSSFDMYALGFCIAKLLPGIVLNVELFELQDNSFVCGLMGNKSNVGILNRLAFWDCSFNIAELQFCQSVQNIVTFTLINCSFDIVGLFELIPHMTSLRALDISYLAVTDTNYNVWLKILHQLSHSNVTALYAFYNNFNKLLQYSPHLEYLIDPSSGRLEELGIDDIGKELTSLLSASSSLKTLSIFSPIPFNWPDRIPHVIEILKSKNCLLEHLKLGDFGLPEDIDAVKTIVSALNYNKTLTSVGIFLRWSDSTSEHGDVCEYVKMHHKELTHDPRVAYSGSS